MKTTINCLGRFSLALTSLLATSLSAADWPEWRGPNRDGISHETGLLKTWPSEGPRLVWQVSDLGAGYSTPSVAGGRIFLMSNQGLEDEFVQALEVGDGKRIWSTRVGRVGSPEQQPSYPGARSTPTFDAGMLYVLGSDGDLAALNASDGKIAWSKNVRVEFAGKPGIWAYAESPLIDGDRLICMPGGPDSTVVGLNKKNGQLIWKASVPGGTNNASYSSIIAREFEGVPQYIAYTGNGLVGLESKTGKLLWRYDRTKVQGGMSILTPVAADGYVFSGGFRAGAGTVKLKAVDGAFNAEEVYFDMKLPAAIGGAVQVGNLLFGTAGQTLVCADFKTGAIKWSERSVAPGALCYADERLYLHGESGAVVLVAATAEAYREHGKFTPPNAPTAANQMEKTWAYPVISDGRLYLRNKASLWSYDIKAPAK